MDEIKESRLEHVLISSLKDGMIAHMESFPEDFSELLELVFTNKNSYAWRASWLIWSCMKKNDERLLKHLDTLIDLIPERPDNQVREFLMILDKMNLTEEQEGRLFEYAVNIWIKINKQPSIRYRAFNQMIKTVKKYPELREELDALTESHYLDSLSSGVKKSISKMLNGLPS